jgi:hypothetical protein
MIWNYNLAAAMEQSNCVARCVAIIVASTFVFFCTTYYQTLLLSIHEGIGYDLIQKMKNSGQFSKGLKKKAMAALGSGLEFQIGKRILVA